MLIDKFYKAKINLQVLLFAESNVTTRTGGTMTSSRTFPSLRPNSLLKLPGGLKNSFTSGLSPILKGRKGFGSSRLAILLCYHCYKYIILLTCSVAVFMYS